MTVPAGRPAGVPSSPSGDGWAGYPGWAFDLPLVAHYAPLVAAALVAAVGEERVRSVVATYYHRHLLDHGVGAVPAVPSMVVKAKSDHPSGGSAAANRAAAQQYVESALTTLSVDELAAVLRNLYGDAWLAGAHAAVQAAVDAGASGAVIGGSLGALDGALAWDAWAPGSSAAAALLAAEASPGSGLAGLLDSAGLTIKGVTGTLLDDLGTALADGVARGDNLDALTQAVLGVLGGSSTRAETIAWTEVARAMTQSALDTYATNGIAEWNWLISPGACPDCETQALTNPHTFADDAPPGHPRCRCCASPVVIVGAGATADTVDAAVASGDGAALM